MSVNNGNDVDASANEVLRDVLSQTIEDLRAMAWVLKCMPVGRSYAQTIDAVRDSCRKSLTKLGEMEVGE